jgi:hypothetical protein
VPALATAIFSPMKELLAALNALLDAIDLDELHSGGLLSRETSRKANTVRIALARARAKERVLIDA